MEQNTIRAILSMSKHCVPGVEVEELAAGQRVLLLAA